jgi:hypothetical protein
LGIADLQRDNFGFINVVWEILRRSVVLTDNRRVPFARRFTHEDFDRPLDLRNGRDIPVELFRLRNGNMDEQRRYAAVEDTFHQLTERTLGLQSHPEPVQVSREGLIIEPTVATRGGEHPIEFAGAGAQEALVLSTLLPGNAGRLFVLDEPAVSFAARGSA